MRIGSPACRRTSGAWGIGMFVNEHGYTSVAVVTALLVSVTLVLCVASVEWTTSRSADVQQVADAAALAGSNTVARFYTIAQVLDACVLSLGLAGMTVMGTGLVLSAVPGAQSAAASTVDQGIRILQARNSFARSAALGLSHIEKVLPALIVLNSEASIRANAGDGLRYVGAALPFPVDSQSDYTSLASEVQASDVADQASSLQEASHACEAAKARADAARERAWKADCVDEPRCMRSRAASLAGLDALQNPDATTPADWSFGMAIQRARAYYARRLQIEAPKGSDIESVTDSLARAAYYRYALETVNGAWYYEAQDGTVDMNVPHLACTKQEVRSTSLYTDPSWPCTEQPMGKTLHSILSCPGATGPSVGQDAVEALDSGRALLCDVCRMDVGDLGSVASISTIANNGYEHYWQIVVDAAKEYQEARNEQAEAERQLHEIAERGSGAFERALEQLRVPRPHVQPAGSWGCVGVVMRKAGTTTPSKLTSALLNGTELPKGVAVSAAVLAPDDATRQNNVLSRFFDGLAERMRVSGGLLDAMAGLWGDLLVSYGETYEGVGDAAGGFLQRVDGVFGGTAGAWLRSRVAELMDTIGLQPADMRLRKPVLVSASKVLGKAGIDPEGKIWSLIQALPSGGSGLQIARALGMWVWDQREGDAVTVAELPLPGTGGSIPLTVDLSSFGLGDSHA